MRARISDHVAKNIVSVATQAVRNRHHPMPPSGIFSAYGRGHELLIQPVPEEKIWKLWKNNKPQLYKKENVAYVHLGDDAWIMYIDGLWYEALS